MYLLDSVFISDFCVFFSLSTLVEIKKLLASITMITTKANDTPLFPYICLTTFSLLFYLQDNRILFSFHWIAIF